MTLLDPYSFCGDNEAIGRMIKSNLLAAVELSGPTRDRAIRMSSRITTSFPSKDWQRLDRATMAGIQTGRHSTEGRV